MQILRIDVKDEKENLVAIADIEYNDTVFTKKGYLSKFVSNIFKKELNDGCSVTFKIKKD